MDMENIPWRRPLAESPAEVLQQFTGVLRERGLLNKQFRITHQDKGYWVFCDGERFFAYRVNENWGLPPGVSGWPTCIVSRDHLFDGSQTWEPTPNELSLQEWLYVFDNDDFELM
jgi:hypothetical protein